VGQQLVMALASVALRAPAAIADLVVIRRWRWRGAGGQPAAGACLDVVLASGGTAAHRWRALGGRRRPGAGNDRGAGRAPSWRSRWASSW
jgi:hypothetical protein